MSYQYYGIDYIEFSVCDMDVVKVFYIVVFGWQFNDYGLGYVGIQKEGGGEMGGFV